MRGIPPVAVLVEPGLTPYGGTPGLPSDRIAGLLTRHGLKAKALSVTDLGALGTLEPTEFPVLVLPYGNRFPLPAFPILRAYHAAGGCLITNGVPFCHPCERRQAEWLDLGHRNHFQHDATGIGTGGFAGPAEGTLAVQFHGFRPNPLGLSQDLPLARGAVRKQWLDTASLSPQDEVIPLIGLVCENSDRAHPVSAIIRHRCREFPGAIDVWIGQAVPEMAAEDAFTAGQMIVRAAIWCLQEKGQAESRAREAVFASLDRESRPAPLPANLPYRPVARPWGNTYLPKSSPPAKRLLVVKGAGLAPDQRAALACLQGLTSRQQPAIWLQFSGVYSFWLDWHVEKGHVEGYDVVADWRTLFSRFADAYRGAVIPDPNLYRGDLLAANVAACEDLIIATPELAAELGIPVKIDLRGRFGQYADGMDWVWEQYKHRFSRHLCDYLHPDRLANGAFAYDIQWRAVMIWPAGPVDAAKQGTDMHREKRIAAQVLAELAPDSAILGFPYMGAGVGLGEVSGVELASRYGKALVCNDHLANLSVMSGVDIPRLRQPRQPPPPPLIRDRIYVALAMSDGDNQNTWMHFYKQYFDHARHGSFPLAFGMGPPIIDLMPAVTQWYYEHAGPGTEFIADVSGIGYIQPENYGTAYVEQDAVLEGFLDRTAQYMERLGMGTTRIVRGDDDLLARYAARIPAAHSLFADMGRYSGREGIANLTYTLPGGMPVFRAAVSWRHGTDSFRREIDEQVGDVRPAFVNGFMHCWTYKNMDLIAKLYDERPADMVFVTPSQLATLYRQARGRGWIK